MTKSICYLMLIGLSTFIFYSCKPSDYYYGEYLDKGEIYYPGRIDSLSLIPGNLRANLRFRVTTDPKVNQVKVHLRNSLSPTVTIETYPIVTGDHGKFKIINLENLAEATYTAQVYSFDAKGDSSRLVSTNQFIYGNSYIRTLVNRSSLRFESSEPDKIYLVFARENNLPKEGNFYPMQYTEIKYSATNGESKTIKLSPYKDFADVTDIQSQTPVEYRTVYKPIDNSLDYFYTEYRTLDYKK